MYNIYNADMIMFLLSNTYVSLHVIMDIICMSVFGCTLSGYMQAYADVQNCAKSNFY